MLKQGIQIQLNMYLQMLILDQIQIQKLHDSFLC